MLAFNNKMFNTLITIIINIIAFVLRDNILTFLYFLLVYIPREKTTRFYYEFKELGEEFYFASPGWLSGSYPAYR